MNLQKALVNLAYLKATWGERYYIDNFLPFLATLFLKKSYQYIEESSEQIERIIKDFEEEFQFYIPYHPMQMIIRRACKKRLLKKQAHRFFPTDGVYKYDLRPKIVKYEKKCNFFIEEFKDFCKEKYQKELSKEEIERAIVGFLKKFDVDILFISYQLKSSLPKVKISKEDLFLISKFIQYVYQKRPKLFDIIRDISIGHLLANLLLSTEDFSNIVPSRLKGLNVYLDTRFVLRLLGAEGEFLKNTYLKLVDEMRAQGIKLFIFRHTYDEIMTILNACLKWIENPLYDPSKANITLRYFKQIGFKESDVELFIQKVDRVLDEYNIDISEVSQYSEFMKFQIDENKLETTIVDIYKETDYMFDYEEKKETIQKDVQSISSIYRLRKDVVPINLKKAKHIFITVNGGLASAVRKFENEEVYRDKTNICIPACVTDVFIGTWVWFNQPEKMDEVGEKRLLVNVYCMLEPDKELLSKWLSEIEKLKSRGEIGEDEYILLRDSRISQELLSEKTLGDVKNFTVKTAEEVLDEIKREGYKKYEEEKRRHEETRRALDNKIQKEKEIEKKIEKVAFWIAISCIIIASLLTSLSVSSHGVWKFIGFIISIFLYLLSFSGLTIPRIKSLLKKKILHILGFENKENEP